MFARCCVLMLASLSVLVAGCARPTPAITSIAILAQTATAIPTETVTPTTTPMPTATPTDTATLMPTQTPTTMPTTIPTATSFPTPTVSPTDTWTATATATATATPIPTAAPTPTPAVSAFTSSINIPTYPYARYLQDASDPAHHNFPLKLFDRAAYDAASPKPAPHKYRLIVLQNKYLRLTFLPDLGGRLYQCVFRSTGHNEFYQNPVIKPTHWGPTPAEGAPTGANWWLAVGGLEWGLPIEEHGYAWGVPWQAQVGRNGQSRWIMLRYAPAGQIQTTISVRLNASESAFHVSVYLHNPTGQPLLYKFWDNAMLAPGAGNTPSPGLQFLLPANQVEIHSTNDPGLPGGGNLIPWPVYHGRDLSYPANWHGWLGAFARPALADWAAAYDHQKEEGIVRTFEREKTRGVKLFGFGHAISPDNWTDDRSNYVELHGGVAETFDNTATLPAGTTFSWTETWFPVAKIGGIVAASPLGALNFWRKQDRLHVRLQTTRATKGSLRITLAGQPLLQRDGVTIFPARPLALDLLLPADRPARGEIIVTYRVAARTISGRATLNLH